MNYPEAEPSRYQMEFLFSDPEVRGTEFTSSPTLEEIKLLPSRLPK